jgi:copper oxidase (laccase) domain-containing protein
MGPDFGMVAYQGLELLVYMPWWKSGLIHGMTTRQLSFAGTNAASDYERLRSALSGSYLALPSQCHGSDVVDLRTEQDHQNILRRDGDLCKRATGDAVAVPALQLVDGRVVVYGVLTADCVPIIVRGDDGYLLIHAGWRGLANGVVAAALRYLGSPREAIILASAGPEKYEVGADVIQALGGRAVYHEKSQSPGKYLLDTVATAVEQVSSAAPMVRAYTARVCTISDERFHSHRRDAEKAGRCMTFLIPSRERSS